MIYANNIYSFKTLCFFDYILGEESFSVTMLLILKKVQLQKLPAHLKFMMAKQKYVQYLNLKNNYNRFITCDICVFVITKHLGNKTIIENFGLNNQSLKQ